MTGRAGSPMAIVVLPFRGARRAASRPRLALGIVCERCVQGERSGAAGNVRMDEPERIRATESAKRKYAAPDDHEGLSEPNLAECLLSDLLIRSLRAPPDRLESERGPSCPTRLG